MPWYQTLQIVTLTLIALIGLPAAVYTNYSLRLRRESKVKRLLELTDKLPENATGRPQLEAALRSATIDLAYTLQYPRTARDRVPIPLGIIAAVSGFCGAYLSQIHGTSWITWTLLTFQCVGTYVYYVAFRNSIENDGLTLALFTMLEAPVDLVRDSPKLLRRARQPGIGDVIKFAADIRDRTTDRSMSTIEAVNLGAIEARAAIKTLRAQIRRMKVQYRYLILKHALVKASVVVQWNWNRLRRMPYLVLLTYRTKRRISRIEQSDPINGAAIRAQYECNLSDLRNASKRKAP